eukprot:TRINITY_DN3322_c0_g1_i1.p1 TRINITY_DN3322_c0_g1~~TRINITY_DN3322_c0_g1_i1.p1  ORF type:complete len:123 (-),score=14.44 TRINITY_DN3322_c0_g1_i1:6-374(-)
MSLDSSSTQWSGDKYPKTCLSLPASVEQYEVLAVRLTALQIAKIAIKLLHLHQLNNEVQKHVGIPYCTPEKEGCHSTQKGWQNEESTKQHGKDPLRATVEDLNVCTLELLHAVRSQLALIDT